MVGILTRRNERTVSTPLPPDDAETRIVSPPPAVGPPGGPVDPPGTAPDDYEPEPSRGLGWGMLLGVLVLVAVAAAIAAVYFATRDDDKNSTTTAPTTTTQPTATTASTVFVPDVT